MVSAAKGAEEFYTIEHHASRSEGIELARQRDTAAASVNLYFAPLITCFAKPYDRRGSAIPT